MGRSRSRSRSGSPRRRSPVRRSRSRSRSGPRHRSRSPGSNNRRGRGGGGRRERSWSRGRSPPRDRSRHDKRRKESSPSGSGLGTLLSHVAYGRDKTTEEYDEYVKDFQSRSRVAFYKRHQDEPWLLERYHPTEVGRRHVERCRDTATRAASFTERLRSGKLGEEVSLEGIPVEVTRSALLQEAQRGQPTPLLAVTNISRLVASATVQAALSEVTTPLEVTVLSPDPSNLFTRTAYALFESTEHAQQTREALEGRALEGVSLKCEYVRAGRCGGILLPSWSSNPGRIQHDAAQAEQLAAALDAEVGLGEGSGARAVLGDSSWSWQYRCDVAIKYLRDVHLYSYYSWTQYESIAHIAAEAPLHCRPKSLNNESSQSGQGPDPAGEAWAEALDWNTRKRLESPHKGVDTERSRAEVERQTVLAQQRNCIAEADGHFRCRECMKLFLSEDFVGKHWVAKHPEMVERARKDALEEICWRNFVDDPARLLVDDSNTGAVEDEDLKKMLRYQEEQKKFGTFQPASRPSAPPAVPENFVADPRGMRSYADLQIDDDDLDYRFQ